MPRYSSNGPNDTQIVDDADMGFTKLNMRMRADQLPVGTLARSENGRLDVDGSWQPRKAIDVFGPILATGNALQLPFNLNDAGTPPSLSNDVAGIYGAAVFSNPYSQGDDYIVLAGSNKAVFVKVADGTSTDVSYPGTEGVTAECDVLHAFNYVFILRDGEVAFQWAATSASITGAFTLVSNGAYTQPKIFQTSTNTNITNGVATITETSHGLIVGDKIEVLETNDPSIEGKGFYYVQTVPTANTFTIRLEVGNHTNKSFVFTKGVTVGLGFSHMPTPPWAIYHSRRLWMPYKWKMAGTSGTPTITSRNTLDELIASDILDQNTYDTIQDQFVIASGSADYIVGLKSFADDSIIVFCRNSIHLVQGTVDLSSTQVKELTREVGCIARKSIVTVGNSIIFLSDNGVYSLDFGDLYNLRGAGLPLSESISPVIKRINGAYADKASAVFHDNRYYLAVPLDSATSNSSILVYSFLNQSWESVDTVNDDATALFDVKWVLEAGASSVNRLFYVSSSGAIHEAETLDSFQDTLALEVAQPETQHSVPSEVALRGYTYGVIDKKQWNNVEIHVESSAAIASNASLSLEIVNPDDSVQLKSVNEMLGSTLAAGEDSTLRTRTGNYRGYSGQLVFTPTAGRPKLRAVKIGAALAMKSQQSST
jgi:hypothetical protein